MRKALLLLLTLTCCFGFATAQNKITGKITDSEDGAPIPYAVVTVKGTSVGSASNDKGVYSIELPKGQNSGTLVFSSLGYQTKGGF